MITQIVGTLQKRARAKRALVFGKCFELSADMRILDIGSEDGSNIALLLNGSAVRPSQVYIADINEAAIAQGSERYGFRPVRIPESGALPFEDRYFDIVYCSSVIEHVTVSKSLVWSMRDGRTFRELAWTRQQEFAREIRRLGKRYFVQTPCKSFPVESHTWLPLVGYLPRRVLVPFLRVSNRCWPKQTAPDWNLLSSADLRLLFPDADIIEEKFWGLRKSIMAVRR